MSASNINKIRIYNKKLSWSLPLSRVIDIALALQNKLMVTLQFPLAKGTFNLTQV